MHTGAHIHKCGREGMCTHTCSRCCLAHSDPPSTLANTMVTEPWAHTCRCAFVACECVCVCGGGGVGGGGGACVRVGCVQVCVCGV